MMNFNEVISNVDDLINGYVLRDGFIFKAIDEPTNVFDAIVIRNPPEQVPAMLGRLRDRNTEDDRTLAKWLQKATECNGFYVLGL